MNPATFQDAARSGLYYLPAADFAGSEAAAGAAGLECFRVDVGPSSQDVLADLGRALQFPEWYGENLDALHDCLTDCDGQSGSGQAVFISGLAGLEASDLEGFLTLMEVLASASEIRRGEGCPLWILVDTPASGIAPPPTP